MGKITFAIIDNGVKASPSEWLKLVFIGLCSFEGDLHLAQQTKVLPVNNERCKGMREAWQTVWHDTALMQRYPQ